jgi:hypothetical protein
MTSFSKLSEEAQQIIVAAVMNEVVDGKLDGIPVTEIPESVREEIRLWAQEEGMPP